MAMKEEFSSLVSRRLENPSEFHKRFRSLELGIINDTSKTLGFYEDFFSSGSWFDKFDPLVIEPHCGSVGYVANRGKKFTGVTGGLKFEIRGTGKYLILGFNNPVLGSFKMSIAVTADPKRDAKSGYLTSSNDKIKKTTQEGYSLQATLHVAREGGNKLAVYKISETS